jgi:hypothetical protein
MQSIAVGMEKMDPSCNTARAKHRESNAVINQPEDVAVDLIHFPCPRHWCCSNSECQDEPQKSTTVAQYARRWYWHFMGTEDRKEQEYGRYTGNQMVIPVCAYKSIVWKKGKSRLVDSQDVVHPNIRVYRGSRSKRVRPVQRQNFGTTKGRYPMCLAKAIKHHGARTPDVIIFYPIWELTDSGRLRGLQAPIDTENIHAMQLSFGLSQWAHRNLLWVFLPYDALFGDRNDKRLVVEFDEKQKPMSVPGDREDRIWGCRGIRVVFYKTLDNIEKLKNQEIMARPSEHKGEAVEERSDQVLLKSWMNEVVRSQRHIAESKQVERRELSKDLSFDPWTIFTPDVNLMVRIHISAENVVHEYHVSPDKVFVIGISI